MDFLSKIIETKRQRVAVAKARTPPEAVRDAARRVRGAASPHAFAKALESETRINLIAEFKRRSPSKGKINSQAEPAAMASIYESAGAAAISVLTEEDYFDGSLEDFARVRAAVGLPLLRKDFIVDDYQIYESAAAHADAVLLIVAALDDATLARLRAIAEDELGMDALVEVHTKGELDRAIDCGARIIGVNNRDLHTFAVSTATSALLAQSVPRNVILVSESGLTPAEVRKLRAAGYRGFLVGETLMRARDPGRQLREFIDEPTAVDPSRRVRVKICGITNQVDARAAIQAGADMLGFNFYSESARFIEAAGASEIVNAVRSDSAAGNRPVTMIGVFVNESIEEVLRIAEIAKLDGVQLHGDETIEYCATLRESSPQRVVIKAVAAERATDVERLARYPTDAIMIDGFDPKLRGGTGQLADWTLARRIAERLPRVFLAGGLSPQNVADAVAAVQPYAVDACSSLEVSPGKKSARRMREFVDAVRSSKLQTEAVKEGN